jgi:3-hydroxyacyl-CoA dehydrogenase
MQARNERETMSLNDRLTRVAVVGAAGKMGSGISLLLAQEMVRLSTLPENKGKGYRLIAVDLSEDGLDGLVSYIRAQARKAAEKSTVALRNLYQHREDLVENADIIDEFTHQTLARVRPSTDLAACRGCHMVFEAIAEREDVKIEVLKQLKSLASPDAWFFSNTSSIPIGRLDEQAGLGGRLIGFHFYNPPAVQRLAELISSEKTLPEVVDASMALAKRLRKKVIRANDIAGFIGNGHFMRDGLHAMAEAARLEPELGRVQSVYAMNKVSQDLLVRPMGIFQLIDYVGVDVFQCILRVMNTYIEGETLHSDLVDRMVDAGALGGQYPDGSQKDGFLKYERGKPVAVYDVEQAAYVPIDASTWAGDVDRLLGAPPEGWAPWRALLRDPAQTDKLKSYFAALSKATTVGGELAKKYVARSREIANHLVEQGVAENVEAVNGVLTSGFFHLYGPATDYLP